MSYYHFSKKEILQKAKERYYKEKAVKYYSKKKEAIKKLIQKLVRKRKRQD